MHSTRQLETFVEELVKFYEIKNVNLDDREVNVYRIKLHSLPPVTFYCKKRETKIELLLNWDAYEKPVPVFRDAYAVVGKLSLELCLRKITPQVTLVAQLSNPPKKFTVDEFNKMLDMEWRNELL